MAGLHDAMLEWRAPLAEVVFTAVSEPESGTHLVEANFEFVDFVWLVPTATEADLEAIRAMDTGSIALNESDYEIFDSSLPFSALAVINPNGRIGSIAVRGDDGGSIKPIGSIAGPFSLGRNALELFEHPVSPISDVVVDSCLTLTVEASLLSPAPESPEATILAYLDLLGEHTLDWHQRRSIPDEAVAEEIAEGAGLVDPVTGNPVDGDANDIYRQLADGVDPEDVVIWPVVNVAVSYHGGDPDDVLAFFSTTGEFLTWAGTGSGADSEAVRVLEVRVPTDKSDIAVYVRSSDSLFQCDEGLDAETPAVVVPFDDIAGSGRAHVDINDGSFEDFSVALQ